MKQSLKMIEKEKFLTSLGWHSFSWTQEQILMGRNGQIAKIDKRGQVRYLRKDEIEELNKGAA